MARDHLDLGQQLLTARTLDKEFHKVLCEWQNKQGHIKNYCSKKITTNSYNKRNFKYKKPYVKIYRPHVQEGLYGKCRSCGATKKQPQGKGTILGNKTYLPNSSRIQDICQIKYAVYGRQSQLLIKTETRKAMYLSEIQFLMAFSNGQKAWF